MTFLKIKLKSLSFFVIHGVSGVSPHDTSAPIMHAEGQKDRPVDKEFAMLHMLS